MRHYAFAYSCVSTLFADMINPSNTGNGFRWYNFPKMASTYVINRIYIDGIPVTVEEKEAIEILALDFAKELVDRSGVMDGS